ncbi:MFS transporter [Promethearchaeum syntrophicum]|uniref:MFS transporter n=1 Tax=Promethearchaeum syntrophicum TaxID=2594042 RepID=A0A5B9D940_9ARCH|nr:MFS transporter [Candidatus Prometheoarchaeum syntrophicum]QEE15525.1 putative symporter YagG [Candidatus Prometheoarchaeum syntrophicum]
MTEKIVKDIRADLDQENLNMYSGKVPRKTMIAYGLGPMTDQMSHQMFQFLIFTYYYAVLHLHISYITTAFIIFAIWDSINDPMIGPLSDKTKSKYGRRGFWIMISIIPFGLMNMFIFIAPINGTQIAIFLYMIITIALYDSVYTIFSINQLAVFSEMFKTDAARGRANMWRGVFTIFGLLVGFVLPTIFISPLAPTIDTPPDILEKIPSMYITAGIVVGALTIITGFLFFKLGMVEESAEEDYEAEKAGFFEMLKDTIRNKTFVVFCIANLIKWMVFKLLTSIISLYAIHVLGIEEDAFMISLLLLVGFLTAGIMFPLLEKLGRKIGWRNGFILTQIFWIFALIPFWFLDNKPYLGLLCMVFMGIGLSGGIYFVDPIIADIIDEDELKNGRNRAGSFYGINGLINRYSTILTFVIIMIVLSGYGWEQYLVGEGLNVGDLRTGLKILMTPVGMIANFVVIILLLFYPLHGEKLAQMKKELKEARLTHR